MSSQDGQYIYVIDRDCVDYTLPKSHSFLSPSTPNIKTLVTGTEWDNIVDDIWYVPKFYHLQRVRLYKS